MLERKTKNSNDQLTTGLFSKKVVENMSWLLIMQIARVVVGALVGVLVARYLGPEHFGLLMYAFALIAMFEVFSALGVDGIVVRDLVRSPENSAETLGSTASLLLLGGLISYALLVVVVLLSRPNDDFFLAIVSIVGFKLVLRTSGVVRLWFEYQIRSKYVAAAEFVVIFVFSLIKIVFVLFGVTLDLLVWVWLAEALVTSLVLVFVQFRWGEIKRWSVSFKRAREILTDSFPVLISGFAVIVYMRMDQIMIAHMLGDSSVGIYSAATKVTESLFFVPMAIVASTFPLIMNKRNEGAVPSRLQLLFDLMALISVPCAIVISVFSDNIVNLLYTESYAEAAGVLRVHAWVLILAFLGVPSGRWYLYKNLQTLALYRTMLGGVINVIANLVLIPRLGVVGAAYGSIVAYLVSNILFNALDRRTREVFYMQIRAMSLGIHRKMNQVKR